MSLKKLGRYDLVRLLGKGAMGLVYEGRDPNLDRRVAIKTIRVENLSGEAAAEYEVRFRTEAHSAARLQHPNIVSVYDSDRDGDVAFLVMEFIEGDDLKYHLDKGDRYTLDQSLGIMADLLSALDYAHQRNIVHRDIKPANLLIEPNGRVKLTDFGVARIQDSGDATRTQGSIVGTLKHMAPEQVQGLPVDARADLFAAGIVLYQLLTGSRPFDAGTDFGIIEQVVRHTPSPPTSLNPRLPPGVDAVVAKALAKSRDDRFTTAREFAYALVDACKDAAEPSVLPPAAQAPSANHESQTSTLRAGQALTGAQSSTTPGMSTVTLEVELVYWKEIKDSEDIEDLQAFLTQFPAGVYAALARRRLKKLGALAGEDSGTSTLTSTLLTPNFSGRMDKTVFVPRGGLARVSHPESATDLIGEIHDDNGDPPSSFAETPGPAGEQSTTPFPAVKPHAANLASLATPHSKKPDPAANVQAVEADATMKLSAPAASAEPVGHDRQPSTTRIPKVDTASGRSGQSRVWVWFLAGLLVLAGSGLGLKSFLGGDDPAASAPVDEQPSQPVTLTATSSISPSPIEIDAAVPTAEKAALPSMAMPVSASKAPDSIALAAERKLAAAEKKAQAKQARAAAESTAQEPKSSNKSPDAAANTSSPPELRTARGDPRQACEDRLLLSFQICMSSQCAKPAFASHPTCVERRSMEQKRREAEQNR